MNFRCIPIKFRYIAFDFIKYGVYFICEDQLNVNYVASDYDISRYNTDILI